MPAQILSLAPAGVEARHITDLFWAMAAGGVLVWLGVTILAVWAIRAPDNPHRERQAKKIVLAGAVVPAIALALLLVYGLKMLPAMVAPAPAGTLQIAVEGEQWWWRVRYDPPGMQGFSLANEVRLPVGEPVEFLLSSDNVIHSFWIPALGRKLDLIPGRVNRLVLRPTRTGTFRGVCAEYCGTAHAKMAFTAIVVPRPEFDLWLRQQAAAPRETIQ